MNENFTNWMIRSIYNQEYKLKDLDFQTLYAESKFSQEDENKWNEIEYWNNYIYIQFYNDSMYKSTSQFKKIYTKLLFVDNWQDYFKNDLYKCIDKIVKIQTKLKISESDFNHRISDELYYNVDGSENDTVTLHDIFHSNSFKPSDFFNFVSNIGRELIRSSNVPFEDANGKRIYWYDNGKFIGQHLFNHGKEKHYYYSTKNSYFLQLYGSPINDLVNETLLIIGKLEHVFFDYENNILSKFIKKYKLLLKFFSLCYYTLFLKHCIKTDKIDLKIIHKRSLTNGLISRKEFFMQDNYKTLTKEVKKPLYSFERTTKMSENYLKKLFTRLENTIKGNDFQNFKKIFNKEDLETVEPIQINFNASEILYFIQKLIHNEYIKSDKRFSYSRLKSCFVKFNGDPFDENLPTLLSNIKKDIENSESKTIGKENQKKIDSIIV